MCNCKSGVKFGIRLLKNKLHPLSVPPTVHLKHGDMVLVRTEKGEEVARATLISSCIWKQFEKQGDLQEIPVIRALSAKDIEALDKIRIEENDAYDKCLKLVEKHNLPMRLIDTKYTFDKRKITFYYTAPGRVDFRELLKDLTQTFKRVRIDLRHIGVRDETAIMEGVGLCGRQFCCCSFLDNFEATNVKLAKDQGMPLNPGKISGVCGRLLCCLNYEYQNYLDAAVGLPPVGSGVMTPDGIGRVCSLHFLSGNVAVKLEDGRVKDFKGSEIEMVDDDVNNIEIAIPQAYIPDDDIEPIDIKELEDDSQSTTHNV
ncbi:MAG: regulatory iron-sulfur-containing complex subunit RicT [Candidatus Gastranaerophilales bacterium]|nr:regulatory iron-sulfur-containing complex subunit RicT [Candidatus Gastranaerophilales bacterium]